MEFSKHNWATISETICPEMLIFGKQASSTLFFQNILTNPIISEIHFYDVITLVSCIIFTLLCLNRLEYGYESTVMCVRIDEVGIDWRAELQ